MTERPATHEIVDAADRLPDDLGDSIMHDTTDTEQESSDRRTEPDDDQTLGATCDGERVTGGDWSDFGLRADGGDDDTPVADTLGDADHPPHGCSGCGMTFDSIGDLLDHDCGLLGADPDDGGDPPVLADGGEPNEVRRASPELRSDGGPRTVRGDLVDLTRVTEGDRRWGEIEIDPSLSVPETVSNARIRTEADAAGTTTTAEVRLSVFDADALHDLADGVRELAEFVAEVEPDA